MLPGGTDPKMSPYSRIDEVCCRWRDPWEVIPPKGTQVPRPRELRLHDQEQKGHSVSGSLMNRPKLHSDTIELIFCPCCCHLHHSFIYEFIHLFRDYSFTTTCQSPHGSSIYSVPASCSGCSEKREDPTMFKWATHVLWRWKTVLQMCHFSLN